MHRSAPQVEQFYIMCITLQGQQDSVDHKYLKPRLNKGCNVPVEQGKESTKSQELLHRIG